MYEIIISVFCFVFILKLLLFQMYEIIISVFCFVFILKDIVFGKINTFAASSGLLFKMYEVIIFMFFYYCKGYSFLKEIY